MNCSICEMKGIPHGELLCPRCGSLVDRDEIIYQENDKLISLKEQSVLKGKLVELANKKGRYEAQISNQKIMIGLLSMAFLWLMWSWWPQKTQIETVEVEAPINIELRNELSSSNKRIKELEKKLEGLMMNKMEYDIYVVKPGDTLSKIVGRVYNDLTVKDEILRINNIPNENYLVPGDSIKLFKPEQLQNILIKNQTLSMSE